MQKKRPQENKTPPQQPNLNHNRMNKDHWKIWEVFVRSKNGLAHKHVGSLHAADADMALKNARDVYTRRSEGVSIWVVPSESITASTPMKKNPCLLQAMTRSIVTQPFTTSLTMSNTCKPWLEVG